MSDSLSTTAMRALLVSLLAGATGKSEAHWRRVVTAVNVHPLTEPGRVASNWSLETKGSAGDLWAVEKAVEIVRSEHPYARNA